MVGGLETSWKNLAQQNATEVDVGLVQHGVLVFENADKGTFSPGTLIEHEYYDAPSGSGKGYFIGDDIMQSRCVVLGVKYADGMSWTNPSAPPLSKDGVAFTMPADPEPNAPVTITGCDGSSYGSWHVDYHNSSTKPIVAADFALSCMATSKPRRATYTIWPPGAAITCNSCWRIPTSTTRLHTAARQLCRRLGLV